MRAETERRMTVQEIALMREIVKWRRRAGWALVPNLWYSGGPKTPAVAWSYATSEIGFTPNLGTIALRWVHVDSLTQAVDVLCALGYLPPRFSSAYREGWLAALGPLYGGPAETVRPASGVDEAGVAVPA